MLMCAPPELLNITASRNKTGRQGGGQCRHGYTACLKAACLDGRNAPALGHVSVPLKLSKALNPKERRSNLQPPPSPQGEPLRRMLVWQSMMGGRLAYSPKVRDPSSGPAHPKHFWNRSSLVSESSEVEPCQSDLCFAANKPQKGRRSH